MSTHDDVEHRTRHEIDPSRVEVHDAADTVDESGMFRIRMPVTSTGEARDGEAFTRERLRGFREQLAAGDVGVFLDHGRNESTGSRYSALGKIGYWANPEIVERDSTVELEADAVIADPMAMDMDVGDIRNHIAWLKTQAEIGIPLASSVGWSESTGEREVPGDADLLEISIVGIPSDPRTTTASAEPATLARAVSAASSDFDPDAFARTYTRLVERDLPDAVVEELGDLLEPAAGAVEAAQQALDWAEEYPDEFALGSEDGEGLRRARQLVEHSGERLTGTNEDGTSYWVEIEGFHSRHHAQDNHVLSEEFEGEPWKDAGYVAHKAWGGDAGYDQSQDVVAALEALADDDDVDFTMSLDREAITQETVKDATPVHVDGEAESTDSRRDLDDPEFSEGDAVEWSSNDTIVRGRVAAIGDEFSPAEGVTITGDEGEAVYLIHELDDSLEPPQYRRENVAKPESSLDESQADLPPLEGNFADEDNDMSDSDTESDTESDADRDEQPDLRAMEDKMEEMREMIDENTRMTTEIHEEMMGGDDGEDEESADEPDAESGADEGDERTVTIDGEEKDVDEALEKIRDLVDEAADAEPAEPKTQDRATDDEDSDDTSAESSFWS